MRENMKPELSVIIASHRKEGIGKCLDSLIAELCNFKNTEIIVAADYPVESFSVKYPAVIWLHINDKSISRKRNAGVMHAVSDIIAFIDDDCRPGKNWLNEGVQFLENNLQAAGVEGQTRIDMPNGPAASIGQYKRLEKQGFRTNNIFYRKEVFVKAGMFDERFTIQREDLDLAFSILEDGYEIVYNQNQIVHHAYRPGEKWDLVKNCVNRRFDPLLHGKHPQLYRKYVHSPFPPGIVLLLAFYVITAAMFFNREIFFSLFVMDLFLVQLLTIKRSSGSRIGVIQWLREYAAYAVSPLILSAALIYGSVKFKKGLFF